MASGAGWKDFTFPYSGDERLDGKIYNIDIPGLPADTGRFVSAIKADMTLALGLPRQVLSGRGPFIQGMCGLFPSVTLKVFFNRFELNVEFQNE